VQNIFVEDDCVYNIDPGPQVFPYVLDNNLQKKKKQPKAVTTGDLTVDLNNDFASEHYFRFVPEIAGS
jgi:hypothetical protein